ncbi:MAG: hypothetical protein M1816_008105 [Peltula sp. TS41687]|nr:MAG: hypothetical protein M1816_008105 [Peltula sp. TS41687]
MKCLSRPSIKASLFRACIYDGYAHLPLGLRGFSNTLRRREPAVSPSSSLPQVARPSLWQTLIPRFMRDRSQTAPSKRVGRKEWNPATFYIVIFLFIGSQAIQMIALRTEFTAFSRRADARISLLKEVLDRVQKGEDVDVEGLLGTGDEEREREWEDVIQQIQEEEALYQARKRPRKRSKPTNHEAQNDGETTTAVESRPSEASSSHRSTESESGTNVDRPVRYYI